MKPEFVARVLAPNTNGNDERGTAYPIAENLLVTASHVVVFDQFDHNKTIELSWPSLPGADSEDCLKINVDSNAVSYNGYEQKSKCDLALIHCDLPKIINQNLPRLTSIDTRPYQDWDTKGYPDVCVERKDLNGLCSVSGKLERPGAKSPVLEMSTSTDTEGDGWCGLSGAPMFSENQLVGIVTDTNPKIKNQMEGVSIPYLLRNDKSFKNEMGIKHEVDFTKAENALKDGDAGEKACIALKDELPEANSVDAAILVRLLSSMPIGKIIKTVLGAQQKLNGQTAACAVLKKFMCSLLPGLFDIPVTERIKNAKGDADAGFIVVPYAIPTSAEMLMANSDNRAARLKVTSISKLSQDEKEIQVAGFRLAPESGGKAQTQTNDMVRDMSNSHGGSMELPFVDIADEFYKRAVQNKKFDSIEKDPDGLKLAQFYSKHSKENKRSYYWIVDLPEEQKAREQYIDLVKQFKAKLPYVTILSLQGSFDQEMQERKDYIDLPNILSVE